MAGRPSTRALTRTYPPRTTLLTRPLNCLRRVHQPIAPILLRHHDASLHSTSNSLYSTASAPHSSALPQQPVTQTSLTQQSLTHSIYQALRSSSRPSLNRRLPTFTAFPTSFHQSFSTSRPRFRDHHFDTLKFVQRLQDDGFSEEQAVAMMRVLADVIEESIQNLTRTMVPREEAERTTYTQKVDFTKLRSELQSGDAAEAQLTRASHERLANDLAKLQSRLRDEVERTRASVRLDLNLEKGRIREEANVQELKIKETEARIEQEVASLRERVEGVKFSTLQWLMGVCTGAAAIILGAWRLLM